MEPPFIRFAVRVKTGLSNRGRRTLRGQRRRTGGLRREEVAALAGMSADYYSRIGQQRGPAPSEQMLVGLARALRLNQGERGHLSTATLT